MTSADRSVFSAVLGWVLWLFVGGLLLGGSDASQKATPAAVVEMTNALEFVPDTVFVTVGDTVAWRNTSLIVHTVTADPREATLEESVHLPENAEPFASARLTEGETFRHRFTIAGEYVYFCIPHEGAAMRGTVIVEPSEEPVDGPGGEP